MGFGFRVSGSGFRVQGFGFRVSGSGFRVQDLGSVSKSLEDQLYVPEFRTVTLTTYEIGTLLNPVIL